MFLEPLVACRKRLKRNWTFYNWAGPNFAPKISPLILAQTNNIYIYTHTINQEHQKPVVEATPHKNSGFIQSVWWKNQRFLPWKVRVFYHRVCHRGMWHRMEISARHAGPPSFASLCGRSGSVPQALPAPKLDSCGPFWGHMIDLENHHLFDHFKYYIPVITRGFWWLCPMMRHDLG